MENKYECIKCGLYKTSFGTDRQRGYKKFELNYLRGIGPKDAKIMLIGMCPGNDECILKEPFVGDAGRMLNACLKEAGISREQIYITNLVKCRPPRVQKSPGKWEDRVPSAKEIKACREYLDREIAEIRPNIIVTLGNVATKTLINKTNITNIHGTPVFCEEFNATVIPLYHPSFLVRRKDSEGLKAREDFIADLRFVKKSSKIKEFVEKPKLNTKYIICDTLPKVEKLFKRLNEVPEFVFDLETQGLNPEKDKVLCISFSWKKTTAVVLPIWSWTKGELWSQEDLAYIKSRLKQIDENPDIKKINHNIAFDIFFLDYRWKFDIQGAYFDTMFGHYIIDPGRPGSHKLKDLSWTYTDMGGYDDKVKDDRENGFKNTDDEDLYYYSACDADCTFRIYKKLEPLVKPYMRVMINILIPLARVFEEMQQNGIEMDIEYLEKLIKEYVETIAKTEKILYNLEDVKTFTNKRNKKLAIPIIEKWKNSKILSKKYTKEEYVKKNLKGFNFGSTMDLRQLLFDYLKLISVKKTPTGLACTDESVLEALKGEHEIIDTLLELRHLSKIYSTNLKPIPELLDENNRIHTSYLVDRTATGRTASKGPNLQNIPKKRGGKRIRNCYTASKGNILIASDLRQIEYRILAHFVNDKKQIEDLRNGLDIHIEVASDVYKIKQEEVTEQQRDNSKAVTFGIPYGRSPISLAKEYDMTLEEAETFIKAFFNKYPKVKVWIDKMIEVAREKGYVKNFFGRIRYLPKMNDNNNYIRGEEERKVVSTAVQGTASDILSIYTINIARKLKEMKSKAKMVLTIHDDLVLDVPLKEKDNIVKLLKIEMQRPIKGIRVPIETEIRTGQRWGSLKKLGEEDE